MSSILGDPFLLSTYSLPSQSKRAKGKSIAAGERSYAFINHFCSPKQDGQVAVAVQGDGIHILDLSDFHPITSHTLGPSTSFSSPPATLVTSEDGINYRHTYVAVQSAPDVKDNEARRVIWSWKEDASGDSQSHKKTSFVLPYEVLHIANIQALHSNMIFISGKGELVHTDLDFNILNSWSPKDDTQMLIKLFTFPYRNCLFVSQSNIPPNGTILVMFLSHQEGVQIRLFGFGAEGKMVILDPKEVQVEDSQVIDISCGASGHMSIIWSDGSWSHHRINVTDNRIYISETTNVVQLANLRFITGGLSSLPERRHLISVQSLGSAFVLLAGLTKVSSEIALLLWDIQFGVLLHSHILPIPSAIEKTSTVSISLCQGSSSQAVLVISPVQSCSKSTQSCISIFGIPFTVPTSSTIANAMGKISQSAPWIQTESAASPKKSSDKVEDVPPSVTSEGLMEMLQLAIEEDRAEDASDIFFACIKPKEEKRGGKSEMEKEDSEQTDVAKNDNEVVQPGKPILQYNPTVSIDYNFVRDILRIVMQPVTRYSSKILRHFLNTRRVSHSMIDGGLLPTLVKYNDWECIRECFFKVVDIPETDLLQTLQYVIRYNRAHSFKIKSSTDEPNHPRPPSVENFLSYILVYPTSQAPLRRAVRECLSDIDDLMTVLHILDTWAELWAKREKTVVLGEVTLNRLGVPVVIPAPDEKLVRTKTGLLPAMDSVANFLQAILDSSFVSLLQHAPSHAVLHHLLENVTLQLSTTDDLQSLCAPLAPFAKTHLKLLTDATKGRKKDEVDWRKRRKQVQEQNAINLGPYQVEELVF